MEIHLWSTETLSEWDDLGVVDAQDLSRLATEPGTYRVRPVGSDEPWRFFVVNRDGKNSLDRQPRAGT